MGGGTVRRPSKSLVVFVLFHAQRVEQRATHLLSARRFVRSTDGLSLSDNLLNLGVLAASLQTVLLCNKSTIATESTISFVADPGNAPLRSPVKAEERDRRSQPQVSTAGLNGSSAHAFIRSINCVYCALSVLCPFTELASHLGYHLGPHVGR